MDDKAEIDELTKRFYALFTNRDGAQPNVAGIYDIFIPEGSIIKTCGDPAIYDLKKFIAPRERLLNDGDLLEFEEEEAWERTSVVGDIAQRLSLYRKSGILRGEPFEGRGIKSMQFVRMNAQWKMMAAAWDDERDGFTIDVDAVSK